MVCIYFIHRLFSFINSKIQSPITNSIWKYYILKSKALSGQTIAWKSTWTWIHAYFIQFQPIQAFSSLFQPKSVFYILFQPIKAYSSRFQSIPACSSIFKPSPALFSLSQSLGKFSQDIFIENLILYIYFCLQE